MLVDTFFKYSSPFHLPYRIIFVRMSGWGWPKTGHADDADDKGHGQAMAQELARPENCSFQVVPSLFIAWTDW